MNAAKVSSFSVCTDAWEYGQNSGSTDLYECKSQNVPDLTKQVSTLSFTGGAFDGLNNNNLYLLMEQLEINGCILQRIGTWDQVLDEPTNFGIWTTEGKSKGCPKAANIADYGYSSKNGSVVNSVFETCTITLKRPVAYTPLTATTPHTKE